MPLTKENSYVLARQALIEFGYDPQKVNLELVKIRENTVFRAVTHSGVMALRLHRPGYRSQREIESESSFIALLSDKGIPVVRLVEARNGRHTVTVSDGEMSVVADAQWWLEGSRPLGDTEDNGEGSQPTTVQFEMMGVLAARLHNVAENLGGAGKFPRVPWDQEGMIGKSALWGDALTVPGLDDDAIQLLVRARELMGEKLAEFGSEASVYGAIHADFTPENILVCDQELVVIDFDDFGDGWYLFDLATALFFFRNHDSYQEFRSALLRGYRMGRPLNSAEEDLLDLFILARGFTYLGWAATRPETETAQFLIKEIVPLVLRLAAEFTAAVR